MDLGLFLIVASCMVVVVTLASLFYKLWWCPVRAEKWLRGQGLRGPSYRFIHGNTQEIALMRQDVGKQPLELSQHDIFPRILPHFQAWTNLYGTNFFHWLGPRPMVVVTDPELSKEVLSKTNRDDIYKKIKVSGHPKKYLGDGLVVADGEKWSRLRKVANHAFHGDCLKEMFPAMVMSVDTMLERWAKNQGKKIEVTNEFKMLTMEVISRTAFGSSYLEGKTIFQMLTELGALVSKNIYRTTFFGLERIWRYREEIKSTRMEQSLRDSILSLVRKRVETVKTGEAKDYGNDYLGSLLGIHHGADPTTRISVSDIVDECKVFYIAGHETTSTMLPWIVVLLCIHPEWQEKAREEAVHHFGQENPTADGITRLKILTMIINESMRLYSPVVLLTRKVHRRTKLGPYELPANVELAVAPLSLHRNPEIWGHDAHLFNPERFSEGVAKATNGHPAAFIPFGHGPRACVGSNFAMNEMKIALVMILQRYKLELSLDYVHSPFQFLTISPQFGVPVVLHPL